jgi:hypothetical protein
MNRNLLLLSGSILFSIIILSIFANSISGNTGMEKQQKDERISFYKSNIDWKTILSDIPQFKPEKYKAEDIRSVKEVHISDSTIIAIVADTPQSVIIITNENPEIQLQLNNGETWLKSWKIKNIEPDSINWVNEANQQTYTQMLFDTPKNDKKALTTKSGK